jgi:hypothetical protein
MSARHSIQRAFIAALVAAGCSSSSSPSSPVDSSPPQAGKEAGPEASPAADTATFACPDPPNLTVTDGSCNLVPFPTTKVPFTVADGQAPTFTGGKLVDGLYTAIKAEGWNVTSGSGRQMGLVVQDGGTTLLWFGQTLNADGTGDLDAGTPGLAWLRANYSLSVASENTLALAATCSVGTTSGPPELLYTATETDPPQLILANAKSGNPTGAVTTYERRGCP